MLYASSERFTVSDTFPLLRFGELGLTSAELPLQPTEVARPGSAEASAQAARNLAIRVNLDDGSNRGFTRTATLAARPLPYLSVGVEVAIGDRLRLTEPVIVDFRNGVWKFNPTTPTEPGAEPAVIRQVADDPAPRVGGAVSVASFNVLNYFTTTGRGPGFLQRRQPRHREQLQRHLRLRRPRRLGRLRTSVVSRPRSSPR